LIVVIQEKEEKIKIMKERLDDMIYGDLVKFHWILVAVNTGSFIILGATLMCFLNRSFIKPIVNLRKKISEPAKLAKNLDKKHLSD